MICSGSAYNMFKHWLSKFRGCSLLTTPITNHPRGVMADCIRCCYSDLRVSSAAHKLSQTLQTAAECEWGNLLVFYLFTLLQLTKDGYGRVAVDREVKIEGKKRSIPAPADLSTLLNDETPRGVSAWTYYMHYQGKSSSNCGSGSSSCRC